MKRRRIRKLVAAMAALFALAAWQVAIAQPGAPKGKAPPIKAKPKGATPKPLQDPHPPLWIAARDPNSHSFAVGNGCNVQVTPLWQGDEEVESLMQRFEDA